MVPKYESLQRTVKKFGSNKIYFFLICLFLKAVDVLVFPIRVSALSTRLAFSISGSECQFRQRLSPSAPASVLTRICLLRWGSKVSASSPTQLRLHFSDIVILDHYLSFIHFAPFPTGKTFASFPEGLFFCPAVQILCILYFNSSVND